jgi:dTDP-4-dehydrorhamnose reductase
MKSLVLVTGSAGRIGQAVMAELQKRGRPVRGFDRVATPGSNDFVVGDLTRPETVERAMAGVSTLIHLAATPDDADFLAELVPNNIVGVYHVFEAARKAGVGRMILASSGQVVWHQRLTGPWPLGTDVQPTPRYWYAACKMFLEAAGRAFAETHGMEVIAVRLGWCPRTREQVQEIAEQEWAQDVYLSPGDAGRFFACAALAPAKVRFAVVYATSKPRHILRYDLQETKDLLGYEPRETWPQGIEVVEGAGATPP